ncbi:MAG: PilN domain-containing protein [Pseudomonadota bacterium]
MKEASLHRMNFLKRGGSGFTYRSLIYAIAAWCIFLIALYSIQVLRYLDVRDDIKDAKTQVVKLNEEKEHQIDLVTVLSRKRIGASGKGDVASIIAHRPRWSNILRGLTRVLPSDVWLDSVNISGGGDEWYVLTIKGKSKSQRSLTNFILKLESSGIFMKTALDNTKKASDSEIIDYELSTQPVMKKLFQDA